MIWTLMRINLTRLLHSKTELLLSFVVPIAFFSIFALIFGRGIGAGATTKVKVSIVDLMQDPASEQILQTLAEHEGLRWMDEPSDPLLTLDAARKAVQRGRVAAAIVLKAAVSERGQQEVVAEVLVDSSDPIAGNLVSAVVTQTLAAVKAARAAAISKQSMAMSHGAGQRLASLKTRQMETATGVLPVQAVMLPRPAMSRDDAVQTPSSTEPVPVETVIQDVQIVDVLGSGKANPVVSMYASGIAVMFLLFGAVGGGGALLEERENTTLERLLSTKLTMDQMLLGKWFYLTLLGLAQVTLMFIWGQLVFQIDLLSHWDGFLMMTVVTSMAAAAFGLFLATLCKTRGQLNALSMIIVLTMSALGGSMVPRYVMSERMRELGMWTFNAWALDGYNKVFWRELSVRQLWPQLARLMIAGVAFLLLARVLAFRWEKD